MIAQHAPRGRRLSDAELARIIESVTGVPATPSQLTWTRAYADGSVDLRREIAERGDADTKRIAALIDHAQRGGGFPGSLALLVAVAVAAWLLRRHLRRWFS